MPRGPLSAAHSTSWPMTASSGSAVDATAVRLSSTRSSRRNPGPTITSWPSGAPTGGRSPAVSARWRASRGRWPSKGSTLASACCRWPLRRRSRGSPRQLDIDPTEPVVALIRVRVANRRAALAGADVPELRALPRTWSKRGSGGPRRCTSCCRRGTAPRSRASRRRSRSRGDSRSSPSAHDRPGRSSPRAAPAGA